MILSENMYVPALRWRLGESQALVRLGQAVKDQLIPFIVVPAVEYDFELRRARKTIHNHVLPFPTRFLTKWGSRPAWVCLDEQIAVGRMDNGTHVIDYIFDSLSSHQHSVVPAVPLGTDTDTLNAVRRTVRRDQSGVAVVIRLEDLMDNNLSKRVMTLFNAVQSNLEDADLIIDLGAPNFEPYTVFSRCLIEAMSKIGDLSQFRNFVLLSTAIPNSFANIAKGTDQIPRHDWLFYKALSAAMPSGMRRPTYGDYTTVHPNFVARDMRKVKTVGKVIYTAADIWATRKGDAFRGNEAQMHDHCAKILNDSVFQFQGPAFSFGDDYIAKCAAKQEGPSNQTRWKEVVINHHITMVVKDLATFSSASLPL